ncbi:YfgM family protein [Alkalilimnicola sp. S0819]|uniref:YfgM family protein n=1 Tax=Alkalilimnicola sp. S0819 TaxID=2613922 RepID=UPI001261A4F9|nr:tetratricopeptide repeat protein [Alkalilimnicola sp. S0819]KAB7628404.1 tetratricopeptide repeat protein [Alkalilimnicola sp. S0819]MPQ15307.1 tetratricopeptide repeat protein [Alkalilimnicola sp. S0819]
MADYSSDMEQVEALKRWWSENGRSIIAGAVIAIVGLLGWQQWGAYQDQQALDASNEYLAFLEQLRGDAPDGGLGRGERLIEKHADSPYAALAALWMASHHVEQGALEQAEARLRWASEQADGEHFRELASLRLANVLLARADPAAALAVLERIDQGAYSALAGELRGDAHAARGEREQAAASYRAALENDGLSGQRRQLLELKLRDLGAGESLS